MSASHPIIAVSGSSGAGTTSVMRTFEQIFRRENVNAAFVEGDSFHRYDRAETKGLPAEGCGQGTDFSHFGPEANLFAELDSFFAEHARSGHGRFRNYLHDEKEAEPYGRPPGTITPWEDLQPATDLLFYEGLHGAVQSADIDVAQHIDLCIGVVPVINLEWIQKLHRDKATRGCTTEAVTDTIRRRMPDYVHYIVPQFSRAHINSSGCRWSTPQIPSSRGTYRPRTKACW
jgi:phosphoribulokinase